MYVCVCVCVLAVRVSRWRRRVRRPQQRGAAVPVALAGGRRGSRDTTSRASQKYRDPGVRTARCGLRAASASRDYWFSMSGRFRRFSQKI